MLQPATLFSHAAIFQPSAKGQKSSPIDPASKPR
jgi:hypothetical protein